MSTLLDKHDAKTEMVSLQIYRAEAGIDKFEFKKSEGSFAYVQAVKCWARALENHPVIACGAGDFLYDCIHAEITNGVIAAKSTWR